MGYHVAVVGATGNVGRELLQILPQRGFPVSRVTALASSASLGREVSYGESQNLTCGNLADFDFRDTDIALFSPGGAVSAEHAPRAAAAKCLVIDNTSHFRMDPDVPLVVPEVNAHALKEARTRFIVANPNCSTIQMVMALHPLHRVAPIKRVVVSTYQSVSGAGKAEMDELYDQTKKLYTQQEHTPEAFSEPIAFNVIPQIDRFMEQGDTREEWKMIHETSKILEADIPVSATCVRVPVFVGHGESVNVEFAREVREDQLRAALASAPGVELVDQRRDGGYVTPKACMGEDAVYVSRLRPDPSVACGFNMWIVSDNLRKGAALNAVQIAEHAIHSYGWKPKANCAASA